MQCGKDYGGSYGLRIEERHESSSREVGTQQSHVYMIVGTKIDTIVKLCCKWKAM